MNIYASKFTLFFLCSNSSSRESERKTKHANEKALHQVFASRIFKERLVVDIWFSTKFRYNAPLSRQANKNNSNIIYFCTGKKYPKKIFNWVMWMQQWLAHRWNIFAINFHFAQVKHHVTVPLMVNVIIQIQNAAHGAQLVHQCMYYFGSQDWTNNVLFIDAIWRKINWKNNWYFFCFSLFSGNDCFHPNTKMEFGDHGEWIFFSSSWILHNFV